MSYTAKEMDELIADKFDDEYEGYGNIFDYLLNEQKDIDISGMPKLVFIESVGGYEGAGEDMSVVFKVGDQFFQQDGYFDSWGGDRWDGELTEVKPKLVQRTEYEAV